MKGELTAGRRTTDRRQTVAGLRLNGNRRDRLAAGGCYGYFPKSKM